MNQNASPLTTQAPPTDDVPEAISIQGVDRDQIRRYFETLNAGEFERTSRLFAPQGQLIPPFEEPIVGPEAIAAYLQQEARGMKLRPKRGEISATVEGREEVKISGEVETALFTVKVGWLFVLDRDGQILGVTVKLLASLAELASLRR
ncbi:nuclear transport factor 2 family protein [Oxynema aestuarii]|jgi:hypothetical protein|uniref:Nuclear transport factor 2 family protein n=1 Tax=Oxynema aestuarii AP17 TaxID=2064643 RepID=A0A6H1TUS9_9CYAN|nr:nuclear transport factor 2 family protein [Oxynema aestuarii]QIZ70364.1 nuclear transport factor 2 family protein [Oxynema aestuarii AP17]RMH71463.1 MAG: DUF4440 domain-containing protein [Cyanobacteria bacterium J007]